MHLSSTSAEIDDFVLANRVNANKIDFFHNYIMLFKAPMKALIGLGRCYIPSADSPSCSKPKSVRTGRSNYQSNNNNYQYQCYTHDHFNASIMGQFLEIHVFEDDGLFTPVADPGL